MYYGNEAEQYSFYRIPKALLTDPRYKSVSIEAKVLYGLLLDRMRLSVKNGWTDSGRHVYIYFTQEDAMNLMGCGKDNALKLFREMDKDGISLIEWKYAFSPLVYSAPTPVILYRVTSLTTKKLLEKIFIFLLHFFESCGNMYKLPDEDMRR